MLITRIEKRPASLAALLFKHFMTVLAVLIVVGCSGGGCGGAGCSSCGGMTPLPNGFDASKRIENAGSVRITKSGLGFLSQNVPTLAQQFLGSSGPLTFSVPEDSSDLYISVFKVGSYTVCPGGPMPTQTPPLCVAEIDVAKANLTIATATPSNIHITGTLPIRLQDLPIDFTAGLTTKLDAALNGDGACPGGGYYNFPVDVDIAVTVDQTAAHKARFGYSKIVISQVVDAATAKDDLTDHITICGNALASVINALKGLFADSLLGGITDTLTAQIQDQVCLKASAAEPCPTGSTADGSGICRYNGDASNTCVSMLLGTQGHIDLGGLLKSISPGTTGGLDFLFAAGGPSKPYGSNLAWGDLNPTGGGATLGMFGGGEASPVSKCVKLSDLALPTGIPIPDELLNDALAGAGWPAGTPGPHVGIAVSQRYANYAFSSLYNSGFLCLGVSTEGVAQLNSGLLLLLGAGSAKDLAIQHETQQIAMVVRPGAPPDVTFGNGTDLKTDPLLDVKVPELSIDFYMFSLDRFIRFMTATFDLDVPVNLTVGPDGLTPALDQIGVTNGKVTNAQLLADNPDMIAANLGGILSSMVGQQVGASIQPIDINSSLASLGLQLIIPDTVDGQGSPGMRKLTKDGDNYLGIFAALAVAPGPTPGPDPMPIVSHTNAQQIQKTVPRDGLRLATATSENVPEVSITASSSLDSVQPVEFSYKIDQGLWHPYRSERTLVVRDEWLRVQGRHTVYVRSRAAGVPMSADPEPAQVEVVIDAEPPVLRLTQAGDGTVTVKTSDMVTADPMVRFRLDKGAWSEWTAASSLGAIQVGGAHDVAVESKDSEGNVATAQQALIRGRDTSGAASAACGCTVVGDDPSPMRGLWLLGVAIFGAGARVMQRRRRAMGGLAAITVASTVAGCSCGGDSQINTTTSGTTNTNGGGGTGGTGGSGSFSLQPGLIGAYSSMAVSSAKDIWVAGYSEADWDNGFSYGDLVVGKWDGTKVAWKQVDGVPSSPPVDPTQYNVNGFRGGQTEPGDDVGVWTSIAIGADDNPAVAYYDRTHKALKFAQYSGTAWSSQTVDSKAGSKMGQYAKLLLSQSKFVIAYQTIEPGGDNGALISKVRIASGSGAAGGWTFEDAAVVKTTPCRAPFCTGGTVCVKATGQCTATAQCTKSCGSAQACVDLGNGPTCADLVDASKIDAYPDAIGDYISIAPDGKGGFGVAFYDRTNGNVVIASKATGAWVTTVVDGKDSQGNNVVDVGVGTSLFIDGKGDWHLTYVNGFTEALQYMKVAGGTTPGPREVVDDGLGVGATSFDDGQHMVGDDSHLIVLDSGEVHVSYQDATAGTLHHATGTPGSTGHTWKVQDIKQDGFAGAFSRTAVVNGKLQILNWWRVGGAVVKGDVRIVSP